MHYNFITCIVCYIQMEQCHGNMDAEAKVKSEYMKYFQQEYDYYYTFYQDQVTLQFWIKLNIHQMQHYSLDR